MRLVDEQGGRQAVRLPHRGGGLYVTLHAPRGAWTLRVEAAGRRAVERPLQVLAQPAQSVEVVVGD